MMSTGLTFGTISALYGLSHGIITQAQYSALVATVIGSAVIPTPFRAIRKFPSSYAAVLEVFECRATIQLVDTPILSADYIPSVETGSISPEICSRIADDLRTFELDYSWPTLMFAATALRMRTCNR